MSELNKKTRAGRTPEEIISALDEVAKLIEKESASFEGQRKIDIALTYEHNRRLADKTIAEIQLINCMTELVEKVSKNL